MFDPNYKIKHRVTPIRRLSRYEHLPPPMVGDPPGCWRDWSERCRAVYERMMMPRRGIVPPEERKGIWFYA